ncbi:MAG TPA: D-glycerate dehydrogenase [Syntrophorhabdus sp.]|nr:D-glycerate dehydrogenase [Syntrophorhabdus sp.]
MEPKVFVTRKIPESGINLVREYCEVTVYPGKGPLKGDELIQHASTMDGIICLPGDIIDKTFMSAAPHLKVVSTSSVGFEHIDVEEATRRGIYIGYTPGILTDATADLAFALLLSMARRIPQCDRFVRAFNWKAIGSPLHLFGTSVWGTTLGIIGLGRIGKAMAERARGFHMRVLYNDNMRLTPAEEEDLHITYSTIDTLMQESDFVSLHTPLSSDTRHLVNAEKMRLMKPSAILINTSRGAVIDEQALVQALKENWIAGAGLDVYEKEPLDPKNPLLSLDNVVLVPHMGSATKQTRSAMSELAARNLLAVLHGTPPPSWLNPEVEKIRPLSEVKMIP